MFTEYIGILKNNILFKNIEEDELKGLIACICPNIYSYQKNEMIARGGEELKGIGIVLAGKIEIVKETSLGNRVILAKLATGAIFGEVATFSNEGLSVATVIATQNAKVMFLPPKKISGNCGRLCESHKKLIDNLIKILANKAMLLNKKIEYLMIKSMRGRLCAFFANMYAKSQKERINMPFNRNELADYLGVSRPSMSRELGRMRDEGLIEFEGKTVLLKDIKKILTCSEK